MADRNLTQHLWAFARWLPDADSGSECSDSFLGIDRLLSINDRRLVTALLVVGLVPLFWFAGLDLMVYAHDWPRLRARLIVRGIGILAPFAGLLALSGAHTRKAYSRVVLGLALSAAVLILVNNLLRERGAAVSIRSPLIFLMLLYGAMPNSFGRQIIPPLLLTAGLIAERAFWLTGNAAGDFATDVLMLLFANVVGVVMVFRRVALEREFEVRLLAEQKSVLAAQQALAALRTPHDI